MCITASKNFTKFRGKYLYHEVKNFAYIFLQINLFSRIFYRVILKDFYLINRCLSSKALYNSLLLCENKTGLAIGSCLICQISRTIMILSICCLSTLLEICLKRPNQWKVYCRLFFFQYWCKASAVVLFGSEFHFMSSGSWSQALMKTDLFLLSLTLPLSIPILILFPHSLTHNLFPQTGWEVFISTMIWLATRHTLIILLISKRCLLWMPLVFMR